ncbi:Aerobic-type carbon monoxide dehydrogenase, large subunit CoxL/CutL-like protein [Roseovarius mucosus DSM 17069]|uniref:Aerobic-type carbon monoxide dehydrogenase, large subunit CoxL/CutL-like protein n=1 Tax=Roseovarius mucosus DSM 17069 TaxID=1288298 RepID=A0A0A0HIC5_9RHOB|nr:xanthine dehydrogenase family protein molybdopterin-binding subunit [Roseovarius mucosus]KGM85908.1 Aerobic-type carbon monoxide dehydrogenase, large subunit CoxL/CutL-like protein [Roseovarius mucosus DSM 17069]
MQTRSYTEIPRVDAYDKVRGTATYGTDNNPAGLTHGAFTTATIGKGRIAAMDLSAAKAVDGVRLIVTHEQTGTLKPARFIMQHGFAFQSYSPVLTPQVAYRGQPVALVVADTLEAAIDAASRILITYEEVPFASALNSKGAEAVPQTEAATAWPIEDIVVGDAEAAYSAAPVKVDGTYTMSQQHQNPMELIGTVAAWDGDHLTVYEGTQSAGACKFGLAEQLGVSADNITVISPYIGGGFGQKNTMQSQQVLTAFAARELGRPVKVVVPRRQVFHDSSFRPATRQRVRLSADSTGRFTAAIYDVDAQTSMHDFFQSEHADTAARHYGYGAFRSFARLVRTDTPTPGYMRAPFEHATAFAIESAVDELAYELEMDPVQIRLLNDTETDIVSGLPHSSRHVSKCLSRGAEMFGWERRTPAPQSMLAENGDLIGMGVAIGLYAGAGGPNRATIRATREGVIEISLGVHEMGQGIRTAIANVVARHLNVAPESVTAILGDTRSGVPQMLTAGSWGSASSIPAAEAACEALRNALDALGTNAPEGSSPAEILTLAGRSELSVNAATFAPGQNKEALGEIDTGHVAPTGPMYPDFVTYSYAAHFVEVRIESTTRRIRIPRVVSMFDCGRVLSPRTARSQAIGGVVWGVGGALREAGEVDERYGGVLNADIAEYLVPVNADIGSIDVGFIDEPDPMVNRSGIKGLGEVVLAGVAPAITNAVYHATGIRARHLPVRIEDLI